MHTSLLLATLLAPLFAFTQDIPPYTEANTGITFQVSEHESGMKFGMALPKTPGKDFIGFFSGGVTEVPWAGATIGGSIMLNNLLVVAWPYIATGNSATPISCKVPIGDVRLATGYTPEDVKLYSGVGGVTVQNKPIKRGTFVKENTWQYMFLCQNCLANSSIALDQSEETIQLAYVVGSQPPTKHYHGATLIEHAATSILYFSPDITAAQSEKFDEWAKFAEAPPNCGPEL